MERFQFKTFSVARFSNVFPITTDAIVLGAWTSIEHAKTVLDIGCGTGILSLILHIKSETHLKISCVDNQEDAIKNTIYNFNSLDKIPQYEVFHTDFLTLGNCQFDLIICNPPYFSNSLKNEDALKSNQRHQADFDYAMLITKMVNLLSSAGRISLVVPMQYSEKIIYYHLSSGLFLKRQCIIRHHRESEASVCLFEFTKVYSIYQHEELILFNRDNTRTLAFQSFVNDYYL